MQIHLISFDIPYPANYGGAIDVFHKIRCLKNAGVSITLHCFKYGNRKPEAELEKYCEKVYYYPRSLSFIHQFSLLPFNVKSRISKDLKTTLLKDNNPIIFEVLHSCYLLNDPELIDRKKIYRHSNIEHDYFIELSKAEKSILKKLYLRIEAFKLKRFEKQIKHASCILSVSEKDMLHFKTYYPEVPSYYLPSFNDADNVNSKTGRGNYILYHGNLGISENYLAAEWLIKSVFSKIQTPVIIAGLNPSAHLVNLISEFPNITLVSNPDEVKMQQLISNAQIHCLYTHQATGLKLKLLNVLFNGRFVITNSSMLAGTRLHEAVNLAENSNQFIQQLNRLIDTPFLQEDIHKRTETLKPYLNSSKTSLLMEILLKDDFS